MKNKNNFSNEQKKAIFSKKKKIIVSSAAGSGKTTILVYRIIEKIKFGININNFLIMTYTEIASNEIKDRIYNLLLYFINNKKFYNNKEHFLYQLSLLSSSKIFINTFHSFCLKILSNFYYLTSYNSKFKILNNDYEIYLFKFKIWKKISNYFYKDKKNHKIILNFSNFYNDNEFMKLIFEMYDFAKKNINPNQWLNNLILNYKIHNNNLYDTIIFKKFFKKYLILEIIKILNYYNEIIIFINKNKEIELKLNFFNIEKNQFKNLYNLLFKNNIEKFCINFLKIKFNRLIFKKNIKLNYINFIKNKRNIIKKKILEFKKKFNFLFISEKKKKKICLNSLNIIILIVKICKKFLYFYDSFKKNKGIVSFVDLEHILLNILKKKNTIIFNEIINYCKKNFFEILIDEYQDISIIQEKIIFLLYKYIKKTSSIFIVGDAKQSIYSFRLAEPKLFINKIKNFKFDIINKEKAEIIVLNNNFRSCENIINFVNYIFLQLMDEKLGQIEYNIKNLKFFNKNFKNLDQCIEILIFEDNDKIKINFDDKKNAEIYIIAFKILNLIQKKMIIYDKKIKKKRFIEFKDIVVLTQIKKKNIDIFKIFKKLNIPIKINDIQNFVDTYEISLIISILKVIDNPFQDIEIISVLRSFIVDLKENDLLKIKLINKKKCFFELILECLKFKIFLNNNNRKLHIKLEKFIFFLNKYQFFIINNKISDLILKIYNDLLLPDYVMGLSNGLQKKENLFSFLNECIKFEKTCNFYNNNIKYFINLISFKKNKINKILYFSNLVNKNNFVRVMTIHSSKGLEFPVVFLLNMTRKFYLIDFKKKYIFDDLFGIGIKYLDFKDKRLFDLFQFVLIKKLKIQSILSEELRKLYVALTRAEQKLFIVGTYKNKNIFLNKFLKILDIKENIINLDFRNKSNNNLLNFILMSLIRNKIMKKYLNIFKKNIYNKNIYNFNINIKIILKNILQIKLILKKKINYNIYNINNKKKKINNFINFEYIKKMNFVYPFNISTKTTNYQSISEMGIINNYLNNNYFINKKKKIKIKLFSNKIFVSKLKIPNFIYNKNFIDYRKIGIATHYILKIINLKSKFINIKYISFLIDKISKMKIFDKNICKKINKKKILNFFNTKIGKLLLNSKNFIYREQPFSMLINASLLIKNYSFKFNDKLLIHGIFDGYIEKSDYCILYDYKIDFSYKKLNLFNIIKKYYWKLYLYKISLEKMLSKPVKFVYLIMISYGIIIDVNNKKIIEKF